MIETAEYVARREKALAALDSAVGVVLAGEGSPPLKGTWMPDRNFYYLTGIATEPGAALLLDPKAENPKRRAVLFLKPVDPEHERWDGYREIISTSLKAQTGFESIARIGGLAGSLTQATRKSKRVACLHPFSTYPAPVSPDLHLFRQVSERIPGVVIEDKTQLLPTLRAQKSAAEHDLMRHAIAATAAGYDAGLMFIRPGVTEFAIQETMESAYRAAGARTVGYNSIVGAGINGTILHYMANTATVQDGDMIVIDSGAQYAYYNADVTRTFPASGTFTDEQRTLYEVVLASLDAGIAAARPGATNGDVDRACRDVIEAAGYGDAFIHSAGHPLGLDVHELGPDGGMLPGMVITIEPGIYLPEKQMGIRIEDDILITETGNENLTGAIPRTVAEIEAAMRRNK
jgi:Xaa-Pro aminopeptidase